VNDRELDMAYALIDLLEEEFDPEKYHDEYRAALQQVIDSKLEGTEITATPIAQPAKVTDLVAALKASVAAAKKAKAVEAEEEEATGTAASPGCGRITLPRPSTSEPEVW
jgi:DNA end-binding protein Ku